MFSTLFIKPQTITCHTNSPYREEREQYLCHCKEQGYTFSTQRLIARELLRIALKLPICPERGVTIEQVRVAAIGWKNPEPYCDQKQDLNRAQIRFIQVARSWLRFLGYWREPEKTIPFKQLMDDFRAWMQYERGLTPLTIDRQCGHLRLFLCWYGSFCCQFAAVCLSDVDAFLADYGSRGNCRISVKNMATALRSFFKYAGEQGWCSANIAQEIHGPRIFAQEQLPLGPSWPDVTRLIASMETGSARDIRNRVLVMLLAIYGFRASEVATLRLEDIDWEQGQISVSRVKRRGQQTYPLVPQVGNAIIRYLQEVRPQSPYREIFLSLTHPYRPITRRSLFDMTSIRMKELGIKAPHLGPHSLRHSCASHLLAEGLSIKEIGDHLGHRSSAATKIYVKVDLAGLREVATFDAGGLL
ncbi:MAG: hypothetical protein A2075_20410 [Geobacteraceae bacterium GWC2_58_44]|nr:MAG: hypothetical protein A2075_20410 [Geobacteraceae bacterium GWC2_58_44]HBG04685.1 integrase [Geobacter sp.]